MQSGFGAGWRQVGAAFSLLAATAMLSSAYGVIAVPLAAEFQPSRMVLMLAMTMITMGAALLSPLVGLVMDRWSMRLLLLGGALLIVLGFVALSFATTFAQVLVIYALFMAPANVLAGPIAGAVLLSRWFVKRRGAALGIAFAGLSMGGFFYPPLIQMLLDTFHWRTALQVLALIVFVLTVPAAALIMERPSDRGLNPDGAAAADEAAGQSPDPGGADSRPVAAREILGNSSFWLLGAIFAMLFAGMMGSVTNMVPLARDGGIDAGAAALLVSIFSVCGFAAKLGFAAIADRMNMRHLLILILIGFAAGMACLIRPGSNYALIALGAGLAGLFGGFVTPLQSFLIARIFGPQVVGRVSGLMTLLMLVPLLVTPPLFGAIFDLTGSYSLVFTLFAALAGGAILMVPYIRTGPKHVVEPKADRMRAAAAE